MVATDAARRLLCWRSRRCENLIGRTGPIWIAETSIGPSPATVTPTALPPLGNIVAAPGTFDVILPIYFGYDLIRNKIAEAIVAETSIKEVQVYPSAGKLVVGLRILNTSDADATAGRWVYLSSTLEVTPTLTPPVLPIPALLTSAIRTSQQ